MNKTKRLYRLPEEKLIGGVCTGLGDYFNIDYTIIRLLWVLSILLVGIGFFAYLVAWILIPEKREAEY